MKKPTPSLIGLIFFYSIQVFATSTLDRLYRLESVLFLHSDDNVDGLFSEYVASAFQSQKERQTRFLIKDSSRIQDLIRESKLPYRKLIQDSDLLKLIAKKAQADSLVRTKIKKIGDSYFVKMEWLLSSSLKELVSHEFSFEEPKEGFHPGGLSQLFTEEVDQLFASLPFMAHVSGKKEDLFTLNQGLPVFKPGDILDVATLEEVKIHPLFHKVVDWKWKSTGRLQVTQADRGMAFCIALDDDSKQKILPNQKIVRIEKKDESYLTKDRELPLAEKTDPKVSSPSQALPRTGKLELLSPFGIYSRDFSNGSQTFEGNGFTYGAKGLTDIWLDSEWFTGIEVGYQSWNYSQKDAGTNFPSLASQNGGVTGSLFSLHLSAGYHYLFKDDFFGPKGWVKIGYKSLSYQLPLSITENTQSVGIHSIFMGLGGHFPFEGKRVSLMSQVYFRLIPFVRVQTVGDSSPAVQSSTDVEFMVGLMYKIDSFYSAQLRAEIVANGVDLSSGATLSQKSVTIGPSIVYFF